VVSAKDLLADFTKGGAFSLLAIIREPLYVVESLLALKILQIFRDSGHHFALVFDEHGAMTGIVSVIDVLESIVGDFPASGASEDQPIVRRDDGSWLVDGTLSLDDVRLHMMQESGVVDLRFSEDIKTLGGFVMNEIGRIPKVGESFVWNGWSFEVVDMDGRRVDKVLLLHPTPHKETGG
jgi:putative hemolysin